MDSHHATGTEPLELVIAEDIIPAAEHQAPRRPGDGARFDHPAGNRVLRQGQLILVQGRERGGAVAEDQGMRHRGTCDLVVDHHPP